MARVLTVFLIGVGGLFWRGPSAMAATTTHEVAQQAEWAFRSAMQAWAYEQYWRLWDMGSRASRAALSREDFTERMRRGNTRPAAGRQVEALAVTSNSPDSARLDVQFGLVKRYRTPFEPEAPESLGPGFRFFAPPPPLHAGDHEDLAEDGAIVS